MQELKRRMPVFGYAVAVATMAVVQGCSTATTETGPRIVQPGAPGDPTQVRTAEEVAAQGRPSYTPADVEFMQGMIGHHQQALEMTSLVEGRSASRDVALLAQRIEMTQVDEIDLIFRWLAGRGEPAAGAGMHAHAAPGEPPPYGMLTPEELAQLAAAEGEEFDRLFLQYMIRHHEGAVEMVSELFASPAGGQESEVFQFASGVAADQPIEIARMRRMLESL